jgi:hypothetical protein
MKTFKDAKGREWRVVVDVTTIKRVRSLAKVNLLDVVDGSLMKQFEADPVLLVDVVYCVCKPQADEAGVSDEQFGQSLVGDPIDHASAALMEELTDFFPAGKRQMLKKVLAKATALMDKHLQRASRELDDPEFDRKVEALMEKMRNGSSGDSPESSASTPAPSLSAN